MMLLWQIPNSDHWCLGSAIFTAYRQLQWKAVCDQSKLMVLPRNQLMYLTMNLFTGGKKKKKLTLDVSSPYHFGFKLIESSSVSAYRPETIHLIRSLFWKYTGVCVSATTHTCSQARLFPCPTLSQHREEGVWTALGRVCLPSLSHLP